MQGLGLPPGAVMVSGGEAGCPSVQFRNFHWQQCQGRQGQHVVLVPPDATKEEGLGIHVEKEEV